MGAPIRLARLRLHNGASNRPFSRRYASHGRIKQATIITDERAVAVTIPDKPDRVTVDCDFGVTETVRLRVDSVYAGAAWPNPEDSDVALSDVSFWGAPPPKNYFGTRYGRSLQALPIGLRVRHHFACHTTKR